MNATVIHKVQAKSAATIDATNDHRIEFTAASDGDGQR